MVSKMRKRASLSTSMACRYSPRSEVSMTSLRMSSIVCSTCTPSAVDRPTAGSASMARMRLPGKASTSSRTIAEHREVLPTPPLPATAMILAFVLFSSIVRSLLTAEKNLRKLWLSLHPSYHRSGRFFCVQVTDRPPTQAGASEHARRFLRFFNNFFATGQLFVKITKKELRNLSRISIMCSATSRQVLVANFTSKNSLFIPKGEPYARH